MYHTQTEALTNFRYVAVSGATPNCHLAARHKKNFNQLIIAHYSPFEKYETSNVRDIGCIILRTEYLLVKETLDSVENNVNNVAVGPRCRSLLAVLAP